MKRFFKFYLPLIFAVVVISACGSKHGDPVEIESLKDYTDGVTELTIQYPSNWIVSRIPGVRFAVFSSNQATSRFVRYDSEGFPGAKIDVNIIMMDSLVTLDSIIAINKVFTPEIYKQDDIMIDGVKGKKFTYNFELNDGEFYGEMYVASKDDKAATVIVFETFSESWKKYSENFANIISNVKLAKEPKRAVPEVVNVEVEEPPASDNLVQKTGPGYSIMISDNFSLSRGTAGGVISSQNFMGRRRGDCNIQVDVIDASSASSLKKIVDENKPSYKSNGAIQNIKLGGVDAMMFPYQPTREVKGRVYFALKGERLYRITMHWFQGEEADFLPIFEKSIASFKFQ